MKKPVKKKFKRPYLVVEQVFERVALACKKENMADCTGPGGGVRS